MTAYVHQNPKSGSSLLEVMISMSIMTAILTAVTMSVQREATALTSVTRQSNLELNAREMLDGLAITLEFAQGSTPNSFLSQMVGSSDTRLDVDTTLGFPRRGTLLLDPGLPDEERLSYNGISGTSFQGLKRGIGCTEPSSHDGTTLVRWAGIARILEDQLGPAEEHYDGVSSELHGDVFYRGDGYGFTFRNPVDPSGGADFIDDSGAVRWGASVAGADTETGWSCIVFEPVAAVAERSRQVDLNGDGDRADVFQVGRIRLLSWDTNDLRGDITDRVLCPPVIVQEECAWGSDLDNDGFEDPMFLWDPLTGRLRVRLFLLTGNDNEDQPRLRVLESNLFLRNGSQS